MTDSDIYQNGNLIVDFVEPLDSNLRLTEKAIILAMIHTDWKNLIAANVLAQLAQSKPPVLTIGRVRQLFAEHEQWFRRFFPVGLQMSLGTQD